LKTCKEKDDRQYLQACLAEDYHSECEIILRDMFKDNDKVDTIVENLLNVSVSHNFSYTRDDFRKFGLPIKDDVPTNIMTIFDLYSEIF